MKTGCILLAAGAGIRFGGDKLKALVAGKPMIEYILSSLPKASFSHCLIVAADAELLAAANRYGISGFINSRPDLGVARSIRMGLSALPASDACLFCVCDQPLLRRATIEGMVRSYVPGSILRLKSHEKHGNPVLFPSSLFEELKSLPAGGSGKTVIQAHPDLVRLYNISDSAQLLDTDTKVQLEKIEALLLSRRQPL
jgi:CTP:molybdopterin cytidylyltransferase MocA